MMLKGVISALVLLFSQNTYSEIVMPVLYGWYTDAKLEYEDSCLQDHYKYTNLDTSSAVELAQKVLSVPQRSDCLWEGVTLRPINWHPRDFPGTSEQWQYLFENSSAITQEASRSCFDLNGNKIDTVSIRG